MSVHKQKILETLEAQAKAKRFNKLLGFAPYPGGQSKLIAATATHSEVCGRAGNRQGKSEVASYACAVWLTGRYPSGWQGRKWNGPIRMWAAGESSQAVRDIAQRKLFGGEGQLGTGFVPKDCIDKVLLGHGVAGAYDKVLVKHESGGISEIGFKSYDQNVTKWQGEGLNLLWCDEEPDLEHYLEGLARLIENRGLALSTFTPLSGTAKILPRFQEGNPNRILIGFNIEDAGHLKDPKLREELLNTFPSHQRNARLHGQPMMGSGFVFDAPEDSITAELFAIPPHFALLWAVDFGVNHPFAAVLLAWDKDADVVYVLHCIRMKDALPLQHAEAMKRVLNGWGKHVPVVWPQDGTQRREFDGRLEPLAKIYKAHGLRMQDTHATFTDGSNSTEAGILAMQERFATARLKVFASCRDWFEEFREYHRKEGQLVKIKDDLMSATRVGIMSLRSARTVLFDAFQSGGRAGQSVPMARDIDIDPWGE